MRFKPGGVLVNPRTCDPADLDPESRRPLRVIDLLWDALAAKGFEKDMYLEMAGGAQLARGSSIELPASTATANGLVFGRR